MTDLKGTEIAKLWPVEISDKTFDLVKLKDGTIAYEGISQQYGVGMCWMRIFLYNDHFYRVYCYGGNKFIIDYDYHQMPELTNNAWQPEVRPAGQDKYIV